MKLKILIADDHEVVRRGLCTLLQAHDGWEICGEARDGREAVEKAKQLKTRRGDSGCRHAKSERLGCDAATDAAERPVAKSSF